MTPSPIERRALDRVKRLPRMTDLMNAQHLKGRAEYGQPIDDCGYTRTRFIVEGAQEAADLITYLEAAACPSDVMQALQRVASWLELEMDNLD